MSDVPQTGGFPFGPNGIDMEKLMRMLQSPGPVNMELARTTAETVALTDIDTGAPAPEPPIAPSTAAAFDDVVRAVQISVADATGISGVLAVPSRAVDRAEWARVTLNGLERVLASLASALGPATSGAATHPSAMPADFLSMMMQQLVPMLLGGWAGSMIGLLSHQALGQYDLPLPLDGPPVQLFVVRNVDGFAREWSLPLDELRYALALREVVHGAQRSVPWVRERLTRLAEAYVGAYELQADAFEEHLGNIDPSDPASMNALEQLSNPDTLLGAMRSARQQPLLEELQRFVSVLEGYTDIVVARLGAGMVTAHERVDEALRRHRLERGDATSFVDRLLGLELDRGHYDAGVAFCRGVVERGGIEQLNRLWTSEDLVPTRAELEAPGLWLARIDLP